MDIFSESFESFLQICAEILTEVSFVFYQLAPNYLVNVNSKRFYKRDILIDHSYWAIKIELFYDRIIINELYCYGRRRCAVIALPDKTIAN